MKRLILIPLMALLILPISCGDDDGTTDPFDRLIGEWLSSYLLSENCTDPGDDLEILDGMCGAVPCLDLTINTNMTYTVTINFDAVPEVENGTITLDGNTITICEDPTDCNEFNFTVNATTLTLTGNTGDCDDTFTFTKQ